MQGCCIRLSNSVDVWHEISIVYLSSGDVLLQLGDSFKHKRNGLYVGCLTLAIFVST